MIKLSKIKIFKRTVLSVLSLTLLLGGAFFAAKMVKTFHVNAAEGGEEVGAGANKVYVTIDTEHGTGENGEIYYGSGDGEYPHFTTRYYSVTYTGTGGKTYLAYCVEPLLDVPSTGQSNLYDVSELAEPGSTDTNFNAIKLLIYLSNTAIAGQTNPVEIMNTLYDGYGSYDRPEEADIRYAFVHATAGFLYPSQYGGEAALVGLDDTEKAKVREIANTLKTAVANNATGDLHDAWLVAQNSTLNTIETDTQHMVWIEPELQSGNIEIIKCDSDDHSKCSGKQFDGIKFTLYNDSGRRIYAEGFINPDDNTSFFDDGVAMQTKTITGGTGKVTFRNLPLGVRYKIVEDGTDNVYYTTASQSKTKTLSTNGKTETLTFYNDGVSLETTATDASDGDKFLQAGATSTIKDVVEYCVVPGHKYTISGVLMDKSTGEPLLVGEKQVTGGPIVIEPTGDGCGTAEMTFEFDSSELGGKDLVVFETLYLDKEIITSHEDINDPGQTIRVVSLGTTATDASDGDKTIVADGEAIINDRIKYCLVAGKEYTIIGTLMNKSTSEPIKSNNEVVSKSITITPEEDCGEVDMEFKFDATGLGGTDVVVFEKALILNSTTDDYDTIASHEDLDDEGQTIKIVDKAPETGMFTGSASSTTGGINILVLAAAGVSVIGVGGYLVTRATAKKRFMSRR